MSIKNENPKIQKVRILNKYKKLKNKKNSQLYHLINGKDLIIFHYREKY